MNKRVEMVFEQALALTPEERDELILRLHVEQEPSEGLADPGEVEQAWQEEVAARVARAERGQTEFRSHDDLMAELKQRLDRA